MYLLDTNICIDLIKDKYPELTKRFLACSPSELMLSSITVFELEYDAAKNHWDEQKIETFLSAFTILPFTSEDAIASAKIRGCLAQKGTSIDPYDAYIAGQALSRNLTVITHNVSEFSRVPELKVEDWID